jgi:hypothetical protein
MATRPEVNVASASIPKNRWSARIALVEHHIRLENEHDLEGVLRTFGDIAQYDDEAWGEHHEGRNGVRMFYEQLMNALPDLEIESNANMSRTTPFSLKSWFGVRTSAGGVVFRRRGDESSSRSAVCTPSTTMTVLPGKKSITTAGLC